MPALRFAARNLAGAQVVASERRDCKIRPTFIMADNTGVTGRHTAGVHATIMTNANAHFVVNELVGFTIRNVTDGSTGVITANTATTVTVAALGGGTTNQWNTNDVYTIAGAADREIILRDSFLPDVSNAVAAPAAQTPDKLSFTAVITGCVSLQDELKDIEILGDLLCYANGTDPNCIITVGYEFIEE